MIERVEQTIAVSASAPFPSRAYNFARASLLELTFRLKATAGFSNTSGVVDGVELHFAVGNPPDFGLGTTQSQTIGLPAQTAGIEAYEQQKKGLEGQEFWIKLQLGEVPPGSIEQHALEQQLEGVQGERKALEANKPSGWTEPVSASFNRAFDAVRFDLLVPNPLAGATFLFEYTLIASRPEDLGPTYTQPFQGGR